MAKTHTKHGNLAGEMSDQVNADAGLLRVHGPGETTMQSGCISAISPIVI